MKAILVVLLMAFAGCAASNAPKAACCTNELVNEGSLVLSVATDPPAPKAGDDITLTASADAPVASWTWTMPDGARNANNPLRIRLAEGVHTFGIEAVAADGKTGKAQFELTVLAASATSSPPSVSEPTTPSPPTTTTNPGPSPVAEPALSAEIKALRDAILASAGSSPVSIATREVDTFLGWDSWGPPRSFNVILKPSDILDPEAFFEVDEEPVLAPFIEVYEGHVSGNEEQLVRLVLAATWARGSVRVGDQAYLLRINIPENIPAPESPLRHGRAPPPPALVDGPGWRDDANPCNNLSFAGPVDAVPVVALGYSGLPLLEARLVMEVDQRAAERLGSESFAYLVAVAAEVDSIYHYEVGIRYRVVGLHVNTDPGYTTNPETTAPLGAMAAAWNGRHTDRDLLHLVTGWPSSYAQANCIGAVGHPSEAYSFTPLGWDEDYTVFHTQALAHEFGHLYAAHHHYGNHVESELATIMIQGYTPGAQPVFSTLEKSVIRGWAEDELRPAS